MNLLLSPLASMARNRPRWVLGIAVVITLVLGVFAADQSTDTELTSFAPDSELANALDRVTVEFEGAGEALQVIVDAGDDGNVLTAEGLGAALAVEEAVADRVGAADEDVDIELDMVVSFAQPIMGALAEGGIDPAAATDAEISGAAQAMGAEGALPMTSQDAANGVDDPTYAQAGLVIISFPPEMDMEDIMEPSVALAEVVEGLDVGSFELSPFNGAVMSDALMEQSESEMPMLLGLSLLLILGIMLVMYRTISDVVIAFVGLITAIIWMMGIGVILGPDYLGLIGPFSQIAMIVPVLIVALGIDYAIHTTARYREERGHGAAPAVSAATAVRTVGGALVLATLTTVVGFLTNLVSPLPPMADFGVFTAVGVLSAFALITVVVPATRNLLDTRRARRRPEATTKVRPAAGGLGALIGRSSALSKRAPKAVLGTAIAVSILATGAATQVSTTFSQEDFIPEGSDIDLLIQRMENLFAGDVNELTYVVMDGDLGSAEAQAAIDDVNASLADIPGVRTAGGNAQVEVQTAGDSGLLAIGSNAGQDDAATLAEGIEAELGPLDAAGVSTVVTSEALVIDEALDALTASQTRGIVITLAAALLLLVGYYGISSRKPLLGVITMVPSVAVVTWVLGTMWLLDISFNVLTAMVASLGIGIGVPFGIHVTHRFLEDRRRYTDIDDAIRNTVRHTGGALAGSAATTAAGFGVLMLASLVPMRQFGMIVAITIVYSFIAAVFIQPACLKLWAERRARLGDRPGQGSPSPTPSEAGTNGSGEGTSDGTTNGSGAHDTATEKTAEAANGNGSAAADEDSGDRVLAPGKRPD